MISAIWSKMMFPVSARGVGLARVPMAIFIKLAPWIRAAVAWLASEENQGHVRSAIASVLGPRAAKESYVATVGR